MGLGGSLWTPALRTAPQTAVLTGTFGLTTRRQVGAVLGAVCRTGPPGMAVLSNGCRHAMTTPPPLSMEEAPEVLERTIADFLFMVERLEAASGGAIGPG